MNKNIIDELINISSFTLGAYIATDNVAFSHIHENLSILLRRLNSVEYLDEQKTLSLSIHDVETLPSITIGKLVRMGINTVEDLTQKSQADLWQHQNFGNKSLTEVKEALQKLGLKLKGD